MSPQLAYYYRNKAKVAARNNAWWKAHPDKLRAKWRRKSVSPSGRAHAKRNREKHRTEIALKKAAWQAKRKEHLRAYLSAYYRGHKEKIKANARRYYRQNPGGARLSALRRRGRANQASLQDQKIISAWMREIRKRAFARCHWCGTKVPGRKIHFDHVVPISKGGLHSIGNICASCRDCNLTKHNRLISDWLSNGQTFLAL